MDIPRYSHCHSSLPNALCEAARSILEEAGPDEVCLREVASRAGVSPAAAFRYFTNNDDLLASVAAEGFRELAAAMETGVTESNPLRGIGLAYFDFALQKRGLFRLMFGPFLDRRAKYPALNEAAGAVFDLIQRLAVSADESSREDNAAAIAARGRVMAYLS